MLNIYFRLFSKLIAIQLQYFKRFLDQDLAAENLNFLMVLRTTSNKEIILTYYQKGCERVYN